MLPDLETVQLSIDNPSAPRTSVRTWWLLKRRDPESAAERPPRIPGGLVSARPTPKRAHVHHWNRLRLLALVDVTAFHLTGSHGFFGVGLPLFLLLSLGLIAPNPDPSPRAVVYERRVRRTLSPGVFWWCGVAVSSLHLTPPTICIVRTPVPAAASKHKIIYEYTLHRTRTST